MRHIEYYENFKIHEGTTPRENLLRYKNIINREAPPINIQTGEDLSGEMELIEKLSWNVENPQIKVFLDITPFFHTEQNLFGKAIISWSALTNWVKRKYKISPHEINHIGFIFSDGMIFHATTPKDESPHQGIVFQDGEEVINDLKDYMVYDLPGNEKTIRDLASELLIDIDKYKSESKKISKPGAFYDSPGIYRQVFGRWSKWLFPEREKDLKFYCSELVANFLAKVGVISTSELESLNESLDDIDEVTPNKLYKLIMEKGNLAKINVEYKDGKKKTIDPEKYGID